MYHKHKYKLKTIFLPFSWGYQIHMPSVYLLNTVLITSNCLRRMHPSLGRVVTWTWLLLEITVHGPIYSYICIHNPYIYVVTSLLQNEGHVYNTINHTHITIYAALTLMAILCHAHITINTALTLITILTHSNITINPALTLITILRHTQITIYTALTLISILRHTHITIYAALTRIAILG